MGEVFLATDTRLDRKVAIKVLPAEFASDRQRLCRFEQEAKTLASLDHPNILSIFEVGTHAGAPYLVSQFLEGTTLREELKNGALPQRKAIDYALQMANGLAAAHAKGIVHRDLKPENIFINNDGRVKILDFGLAKLRINRSQISNFKSQIDGVGPHDAVTLVNTTEPGVVLGTVGYMSPEQVRGEEADHRSDIFAFGCILYEMLSGQRAFRKETGAETMTAILKEEPAEISTTNRSVSFGLERIVRRCVEKNRELRFQTASDLAFALEALSGSGIRSTGQSAFGSAAEASARPRRRGEVMAWAAATVMGLVAVAATALWVRSPKPASEVRLTIPSVTAQYRVIPGLDGDAVVSPDGQRVVLIAKPAEQDEAPPMLWVRPLNSSTAKALEATQGAVPSPFWSPDGRQLGFFDSAELKVVDLESGVVRSLARYGPGRPSGTWSPEGWIVFATWDGLRKIRASGGEAIAIDQWQIEWKAGGVPIDPRFLPDGKRFLFLGEGRGLYVGSIDSDDLTLIGDFSTRGEYIDPGYLLFVREGNLMAQKFDPDRLRLSGDPMPVASSVVYFSPAAWTRFSASRNGTIAYLPSTAPDRLVQLDAAGRIVRELSPRGAFGAMRISPNADRVAVTVTVTKDGTADLWLFGLNRDTKDRFTMDPGWEGTPIWSPDATAIYFSANPKGAPDLFRKEVDGSSEIHDVLVADGLQFPTDISPDGRWLLFDDIKNRQTNGDIYYLDMSANASPEPFLQTPFTERLGRFSDDGKWIAYVSNETGTDEVYLRPFPGPGTRLQVSTAGGRHPRWSSDGKKLFFKEGKNQRRIMAVELEQALQNRIVQPVLLFEAALEFREYEPLPNGDGFLVIATDEIQARPPIEVILNWQPAATASR